MKKEQGTSVSNDSILKAINELRNEISESNRLKIGIVDIHAAAKLFNLKVSYLYQLNSKTDIPYLKPNGKKVYYELDKLKDWFRNRSQNNIFDQDYLIAEANNELKRRINV